MLNNSLELTGFSSGSQVGDIFSVAANEPQAAPGSFAANAFQLGGEFLVNTQTASNQQRPTITGLSNGGFVVTWYDSSGTLGDASGSSIKAQVFDAAGAKLGSEFLVNTQAASDQTIPTITGLSNGGFVITWQDLSGTLGDASGGGIKAQVFTAAGAMLGSEFLVNTQTESGQVAPTITGLSNGGFVVTWTDQGVTPDDGSGSGIRAQVFDAAGAKVGIEFLVNTQTFRSQVFSTITGLANGGFVVTWQDSSFTLGDASGSSIKAQVFDAAGVKLGSELLVNTQTASNQLKPTITGLSNGGFVITWYDNSLTLGDASGASIKAQVFDAAGAKLGSEFLVNTQTASNQFAPTIAGLSNGGFVVTWYDFSGTLGDASGTSIKAQVFDPTGAKLDSEFLVNTQTANGQQVPSITALSSGGFVVTWEDGSGTLGDASGTSIKAQIFTLAAPNAAPSGADATLTATEDAPRAFSVADFGFADIDGNMLQAVRITTLPGAGTLTLNGIPVTAGDFVAASEIAASHLVYTPGADGNGTGYASFTFQVQDNGGTAGGGVDLDQSPNTLTFNITAQNDAPVLGTGGGSDATFVEGSAPVAVAPALTVSDVDSATLASATVSITFAFDAANDVLAFTNNNAAAFGNIAASYDSATGVLTLISAGATATVAQFEASLRAVTYANSSDNPGGPFRVLLFNANDGTADGDPVGRAVNVVPVNDAPVANPDQFTTVEDTPLQFSFASLLDNDTDPDSSFRLGDFSLRGNGSFTSNGGIVTFTPAKDFVGDAIFDYTILDSDGATSSSTVTVTVTPVNDAPVADLNGAAAGIDTTASYTENDAAVKFASAITLSDVDNTTLTGATVTIASGFVAGDVLRGNGSQSGTNPDGIAFSYNASTGVLTLSGTASVAAYQSALATVAFKSDSNDPGAARDITVTVTDGTASSAPAHVALTVAPINDAPVNTVPGAQSGAVGSPLVFSSANGNALVVTDPDAGSAAVRVKLAADHGAITLAGSAGVTVTGDGTHALVLVGSIAAINAALDGLRYQGDAGYTGSDTLTITTNDRGNSGGGGPLIDTDSIAITLAPPPPITGDAGDNTVVGTPQRDVFDLRQGGSDNASGLGDDDTFYFGAAFSSGDIVDGGAGTDQLVLQGNYGGNVIILGAGQLVGIEMLRLLSASDASFGGAGGPVAYSLRTNDANVASGQTLVVQADTLAASEALVFQGFFESNGSFQIVSGAGNDFLSGGQLADIILGGAGNDFIEGQRGADQLTGGAGNDRFHYLQTNHSPNAARDHITDFSTGDIIDLGGLAANTGGTSFSFIGSGAQTGARQVQVIQSGSQATVNLFLDGDAIADMVIDLTVADGHTLTAADFSSVTTPSSNGQPLALHDDGQMSKIAAGFGMAKADLHASDPRDFAIHLFALDEHSGIGSDFML